MEISHDLDNKISHYFQCILYDENGILCSIPEEKKIKDVLFTIGSFKAPEPNDLSAFVYKN